MLDSNCLLDICAEELEEALFEAGESGRVGSSDTPAVVSTLSGSVRSAVLVLAWHPGQAGHLTVFHAAADLDGSQTPPASVQGWDVGAAVAPAWTLALSAGVVAGQHSPTPPYPLAVVCTLGEVGSWVCDAAAAPPRPRLVSTGACQVARCSCASWLEGCTLRGGEVAWSAAAPHSTPPTRLFVTGAADGSVVVWEVGEAGSGHGGEPTPRARLAAVSPGGGALPITTLAPLPAVRGGLPGSVVLGGMDGTLALVAQAHVEAVLGCITLLTFHPAVPSLLLAAGTLGWGLVSLDPAAPLQPSFVSPLTPSAYTCGAWSPVRPALIVLGREDGSLETWDVLADSCAPVHTLHVTQAAVTALSFDPGSSGKLQDPSDDKEEEGGQPGAETLSDSCTVPDSGEFEAQVEAEFRALMEEWRLRVGGRREPRNRRHVTQHVSCEQSSSAGGGKPKRRVVVTGQGVVTSLGQKTKQFYEKLLAGTSGIAPIEGFDTTGYSTTFAGEVKSVDAGPYVARKWVKRMDEVMKFMFVAGKQALEDAGLPFEGPDLDQLDRALCGILIGTAMGGMTTFASGVEALTLSGYRKMNPFCIPFSIGNMGGAMLAMDLGFRGPNYSISTACATGNYCIMSAADHIRNGDAVLMLAGGSDAAVIPAGIGGFIACKALSRRNDAPQAASRPWDADRDGFVMGEGAGVLVLEELEHALARGANILAEFIGGAATSDAHHMTEPEPNGKGVRLCLERGLKAAGVTPEDVTYVNAHGTSTPAGDVAELRAIRSVLPGPGLRVNSTKSMIGHLLGAAGAVEAVATIQALRTGWLHPNLNLENPDKGVDAACLVGPVKEQVDINVALSNSFGFGGHNSCILFKKFAE